MTDNEWAQKAIANILTRHIEEDGTYGSGKRGRIGRTKPSRELNISRQEKPYISGLGLKSKSLKTKKRAAHKAERKLGKRLTYEEDEFEAVDEVKRYRVDPKAPKSWKTSFPHTGPQRRLSPEEEKKRKARETSRPREHGGYTAKGTIRAVPGRGRAAHIAKRGKKVSEGRLTPAQRFLKKKAEDQVRKDDPKAFEPGYGNKYQEPTKKHVGIIRDREKAKREKKQNEEHIDERVAVDGRTRDYRGAVKRLEAKGRRNGEGIDCRMKGYRDAITRISGRRADLAAASDDVVEPEVAPNIGEEVDWEVAQYWDEETVADFLKRGGKITKLNPRAARGSAKGKMKVKGGRPTGPELGRKAEKKMQRRNEEVEMNIDEVENPYMRRASNRQQANMAQKTGPPTKDQMRKRVAKMKATRERRTREHDAPKFGGKGDKNVRAKLAKTLANLKKKGISQEKKKEANEAAKKTIHTPAGRAFSGGKEDKPRKVISPGLKAREAAERKRKRERIKKGGSPYQAGKDYALYDSVEYNINELSKKLLTRYANKAASTTVKRRKGISLALDKIANKRMEGPGLKLIPKKVKVKATEEIGEDWIDDTFGAGADAILDLVAKSKLARTAKKAKNKKKKVTKEEIWRTPRNKYAKGKYTRKDKKPTPGGDVTKSIGPLKPRPKKEKKILPDGASVKIMHPEKRKVVKGKVVRHDKGSGGRSPFYVISIPGVYQSVKVSDHNIRPTNEEYASESVKITPERKAEIRKKVQADIESRRQEKKARDKKRGRYMDHMGRWRTKGKKEPADILNVGEEAKMMDEAAKKNINGVLVKHDMVNPKNPPLKGEVVFYKKMYWNIKSVKSNEYVLSNKSNVITVPINKIHWIVDVDEYELGKKKTYQKLGLKEKIEMMDEAVPTSSEISRMDPRRLQSIQKGIAKGTIKGDPKKDTKVAQVIATILKK